MKLKPYSAMKDSGIEWIGKIPEHWQTPSVSKIYDIQLGKMLQPKPESNDEKLVPYLKADNVHWERIEINDLNEMWANSLEITKYGLKNGDLLVCEGGEGGRSAIYFGKIQNCIIQNALHRVRGLNGFDVKYLMYVLIYCNYIKWLDAINNKATIAHFTKEKFSSLHIPLSFVVNEQKQIISFLDEEISKVDSEISINQKLIEIIKVKRQSIINQAVTKGLDPTVPMKDSGIERIGRMPEQWQVNKIKFTSYVKGRIGWQGLRSEEFTDFGSFLITGTDFEDGRINWNSCHHVENWRYEQDQYIQIKEKDILITKDGTIGKVAYIDKVPDKTTLNSGVMVIRPINNNFEPTYLFWLLKSNQFIDFIEMIKSGSTIQHLYQETFENFKFTLPRTLGEQKSISKFLDKKINQTDGMLYMISCQIGKLQEFRQSLISSAVTGKIDLRNYPISA